MKAILIVLLFVCAVSIQAQTKHHKVAVVTPATCDESLWKHVYIGDRRRFDKPQDRLQVIDRCKTVRGKIVSAGGEGDGDFHLRLILDKGQPDLLNKKNRQKLPRGQGGALVVEPICVKKVTQKDTLKEGVCKTFSQSLPDLLQIRRNARRKIATHVTVTGAFVTDAEHRWNEIHPVTILKIIP